jgi:hypothetical protein
MGWGFAILLFVLWIAYLKWHHGRELRRHSADEE